MVNVRSPATADQLSFARTGREDHRAGSTIAHVVSAGFAMVDLIAAARRGGAHQAGELRDESLVVEKPRASCREQRQGIEVNLGSLSLGMDKLNAVTTEGGNRPSCRVAVRGDRGDAVALRTSAICAAASSGLNGAFTSTRQSRTAVSPSACATAAVNESFAPPLGSVKPT